MWKAGERGLVLAVMVAGAACNQGRDRGANVRRDGSDEEQAAPHTRDPHEAAAYADVPDRALLLLLQSRVLLETTELDGAIRALSRRSCGALADSARIEDLYPMEHVLGERRFLIACGGVVLEDHSSRCGALPAARRVCTPRGKPAHPPRGPGVIESGPSAMP